MATFKARARALDMLGRQQIAGIPTAVSELFKNAHDAYADHVEVDYYRSDGLFILRDDGLGMTKEDFEERWLTLGTESKLNEGGLKPPPIDKSKMKRIILGEKGVGRLAISVIGPQVLVMTRAKREDKLHDLVVAYIHWGFFELAGVDLDEIEIPINIVQNGKLPDKLLIEEMVSVFNKTLENLKNRISTEKYKSLKSELSEFIVDPSEIDQFLNQPSLAENGTGTHFIIKPASVLLPLDIDGDDSGKATPLTKALLGFTNTMIPEHEEPVIKTAFRDFKTDVIADDLIGEEKFFTPEEFKNADHHITGEFDKFGQFKGTISIYGKVFEDHIINWRGAKGIPIACGPFKISFAEVMGANKDSTIPPEDWSRLYNKMSIIGGLYIYKDGIRILPYGNTDYDWLDIEYHRTKSAYYYHFSHRKIFGVIEISNTTNHLLSEKAGREGFRENIAYRQFRSIIKNFLIQLVADFFREEGTYFDHYNEFKSELNRLESARRKREQQVTQKKGKLKTDLEKFFTDYDSELAYNEVGKITEEMEFMLNGFLTINDPKKIAEEILVYESTLLNNLNDLQNKYTVTKPRGVGLSKNLQREWINYLKASEKLKNNVFTPARELIEQEIGLHSVKARIELDKRLRIERAVDNLYAKAKKTVRGESKQTRVVLEEVESETRRAIRESIANVDEIFRIINNELEKTNFKTLRDEEIVSIRNDMESRLINKKEEEQTFLQYIRTQLEGIDFKEGVGQLDQIEALEQKTLALEEQAEADLQLTQLGMAIEIINHEFTGSVKSMRNYLRQLKGWADVNESFSDLYQNIRATFDHLDGYLTMFTPLHRRLERKKVEIFGSNIHKFIEDLFSERFRRHNINLKATDAFIHHTIIEYTSSIYPVFVNIVDNAVFWLKDVSHNRIIEFDYKEDCVYISNNGPSIPERDWESIFENGFTRKPGGRGLGLYISKEVLKRIDYELTLDEHVNSKGVIFKIQKPFS